MLSWALAFFTIAVISAVFGFSYPPAGKYASVPPEGWSCPKGWRCSPDLPLPPANDFICPAGWSCVPPHTGVAEIAKILFVVFTVLFLVSLVAGLVRRP